MRLALLQTRPQADAAGALATLDRMAAMAIDDGAEILMTPEMFMTGYNIGPERIKAVAEPQLGALAEQIGEIASRHGLAILYGFPALMPDDTVMNAIQFATPETTIHAAYAKTHLFGEVDRSQFSAGSELVRPFRWRDWSFGLAICYDIEFPEVARWLTLAGADAILVPTANMEPFRSVPNRIVPARAEENGVYVAYANYCGSEGDFDYCGLSCVVGPNGEDVVRAENGQEMLIAGLSKSHLAEVRSAQNYLEGRRPELYRGLS